MSTAVDLLTNREYKYGFTTEIEEANRVRFFSMK